MFVLCISRSAKQMQLLAFISKGGFKNICAWSSVGGNNVKSLCHSCIAHETSWGSTHVSLPKCFGAKFITRVSVLCILGSAKHMQLLAFISKGGFKNICAWSSVGGNNVKSLCTKLHCARDHLSGDPCVRFHHEIISRYLN